ncbi:MAG: metal ABC transporter permease [Negativicutes bacterium]|nr:metal ABC transporter permease [Negativicutes bacterium]
MEIWQYDFMQRAFAAGMVTAIVCPLIGMFVVVRRQSLIGEGLGHIAFAGVTGGYLAGVYPAVAAAGLTVAGAIVIEIIRRRHSQYADMGLAVVFYAGLAIAIIFSTLVRIPGAGMLSFLFGSIMTVSQTDLLLIVATGLVILAVVYCFFDKLMLIAFDEDVALLAGINTVAVNMLFSIVTALVVVTGMTVIGILLVSASMIIPVAAAHVLKLGFRATMIAAVLISVFATFSGLVLSFYLDIAPGGTIVMTSVSMYTLMLIGQAVQSFLSKTRRRQLVLPAQK